MVVDNAQDETDWEYEYDEYETEDVYITVDLTTHVAPTFTYERKTRTSRGHKESARSNKSLASLTQRAAAAAAAPETQRPQPDRLQLIDLHGDNPVLSFDNSLFTCQWATDVGTSLYLTPPQPDTDPEHPPLRSTPSFNLLGTSFARLVAIPATITPRAAPPNEYQAPPPLPNPQLYTTQEGDIIKHADSGALEIQLPSTASASKVAQARFLERLSAIKASRGDKDIVPTANIKIFKHPAGWEKERDEWIAKETALSAKDRLEAEVRRNSRRKTGHSTTLIKNAGPEDTTPGVGAENSEQDGDTTNPLPTKLPKRTRGGPRGGATSSKRLRESLGLPEARRDKKIAGMPPRQIRSEAEIVALAGLGSASADRDAAAAERDVEELEMLAGAETPPLDETTTEQA